MVIIRYVGDLRRRIGFDEARLLDTHNPRGILHV